MRAPAATTAAGVNPDPAWDYKGLLWDYRRIGLPKGWKTTAGSPKVTVGVADDGAGLPEVTVRSGDILIPKNTQLPTSATRVYRTVVDNQPRVRVKVLQGEAHQADACISIGECWIE